MSKEVMIGMLKVAKNGNDLLQILDALTDNEEDNITGYAVDFVGDIVNFWWYWERGKNEQTKYSYKRTNSVTICQLPQYTKW